MAESAWLVLYELGPTSSRQSWENLPTRFGEKNKSYLPPERTVPFPITAKLIYVEAESEFEAAEAVKIAYGGPNNGVVLAVRASKVTSVAP